MHNIFGSEFPKTTQIHTLSSYFCFFRFKKMEKQELLMTTTTTPQKRDEQDLLAEEEDDEDALSRVPVPILRRVNALKNLQLKMIDIEAKFYEELHLLECKYAPLYEPLLAQRDKIVSGEYEPNDDEAKWKFDDAETA